MALNEGAPHVIFESFPDDRHFAVRASHLRDAKYHRHRRRRHRHRRDDDNYAFLINNGNCDFEDKDEDDMVDVGQRYSVRRNGACIGLTQL